MPFGQALKAQAVQVGQLGEPKRQVEVLTFVPEFDPGTPVGRETRHFLPRVARDRADQRNRQDVGMGPQGGRYDVGGNAELAIAVQQETVLLLDAGPRGRPHCRHFSQMGSFMLARNALWAASSSGVGAWGRGGRNGPLPCGFPSVAAEPAPAWNARPGWRPPVRCR